MIHYNAAHLYILQTFDDEDGGGADGADDKSSYLLSTYFLGNALSAINVFII